MNRYSRRILEHLSNSRYQPRKLPELARDLSIDEQELKDFETAVEELIDEGQVLLSPANAIALPPPGRQMTGSFRLHRRGFGFIVPDSATEHGDLFVPQGCSGGALTGDRVKAEVVHQRGRAGEGRSPYIGRIVEIVQRSQNNYVGNLVKRGTQWLVEIDGHALKDPVIVRDPHAKNANVGDKVVVELLRYPDEDGPGEGVITEVLGEQGEPDVETVAVMRAFGFTDQFPPPVLAQARDASKRLDQADKSKREDLTKLTILTIDPPDAKDFDDAINIRRLDPPENGALYELGIHIADVSYFVEADSALDIEARKRGNSVYLPRKVVPMLPEVLSNGVCSLQEGVDRLCKSAFIRYDGEGKVVAQRFSNTIIRSAKRFTYLEAQGIIDGDLRAAHKHARTDAKYPGEVVNMLKLMNELATVIRKRRLDDGMIVLGLPQVELVFDDSGRVVDAVPEDTSFTHTIIEMFMVEANEAVARLFDSLQVPLIRRIHPDPPVHDIDDLRQFARVAGHNIPARPTRKELQMLLDSVRGKPAQKAVHLAVLRTLSKAEYSPLLIGHFALASEHYAHFTSPIRRYPDLLVHRALDAYFDLHPEHRERTLPGGRLRNRLSDQLRNDPRCPSETQLVEMGRHCSTTERNAEAAERELRTFLVLDLLSRKLGEDFPGTVTGVTSEGVFVQIDQYLVDGFIRTTDLAGAKAGGGERWRLNRTTGALVAQRSGKTITIGERFVVRIAKVIPTKRQLDLVIVSGGESRTTPGEPAPQQPKKKQHRKQNPGAKKAHQQTSDLKHKFKQRRKRR